MVLSPTSSFWNTCFDIDGVWVSAQLMLCQMMWWLFSLELNHYTLKPLSQQKHCQQGCLTLPTFRESSNAKMHRNFAEFALIYICIVHDLVMHHDSWAKQQWTTTTTTAACRLHPSFAHFSPRNTWHHGMIVPTYVGNLGRFQLWMHGPNPLVDEGGDGGKFAPK